MIDTLWSVFSYVLLGLFSLTAIVVLGGWAWLTLVHLIRGSGVPSVTGESQPVLNELGVGRQSLGAFGRHGEAGATGDLSASGTA